MSITSKILPALALAIALSPLAAQARNDHQPNRAQIELTASRQDPVTASSATIDNPMTIYSGNATAASTGG
jgi:hypothetical protein